jgi:hypothetical protein
VTLGTEVRVVILFRALGGAESKVIVSLDYPAPILVVNLWLRGHGTTTKLLL